MSDILFDSFGENAFGDLFADVAETLLPMGGGTMQILRPGNGQRTYDRENDIWTEPEPRIQNIAFVDEASKAAKIESVGGVSIESGDLIGVVVSAHVQEELKIGVDKLAWAGKTYLLKSTETIRAGETGIIVRLLGELAHDAQ